ncbi:hypothetical protein C2W62_25195 [Candidatus Entotheonella serta]|nr:hypothetical protein C2W62_25195 [Candidatus Entotheonella serta]
MALTTMTKNYINYGLSFLNLRLETLTAERCETKRLLTLDQSGHFSKPHFHLPNTFDAMSHHSLLASMSQYQSCFDDFQTGSNANLDYSFNNHFFTSPDAEILYTIIREYKPRTVLEVGCGNSTKLFRQAIHDGQTNTHLISVDPRPRLHMADLADTFILAPIETLGDIALDHLRAGDVLFIDSSHAIDVGNDVIFCIYISSQNYRRAR